MSSLVAVADIGRGIELLGVAVIAISAAGSLGQFAFSVLRRADREAAYRDVRRHVGQGILLGLEVLVAGDIVRTVAADPSLTSVAVLGGIVLIRTFLSVTIDTEVNGTWPWRRGARPVAAKDRGQDTVLRPSEPVPPVAMDLRVGAHRDGGVPVAAMTPAAAASGDQTHLTECPESEVRG